MIKKVLALSLALVLCFSTAIVSFAAESGSASGDNKVIKPLMVTVVPLNFDVFAIDALNVKKSGQLYCGDNGFVFANKSSVPVMLNTTLTMTAKNDTNIVYSSGAVDKKSLSTDEKNIYLAIEAAAEAYATEGTTNFATSAALDIAGIDDPRLTQANIMASYGNTAAAKIPLVATGATTDKATVSFSLMLNAGIDADEDDLAENATALNGDDNYCTDEQSLSAFKFYADLTTYSSKGWDNADLSFDVAYKFVGLNTDDYDEALDAGKIISGTHNLYATAAPADQIDNLTIYGLTAPVTGGTPVSAITDDADGQYKGTVTWNGNPTTFAASTVYTATVTLTDIADGYTFAGLAADAFDIDGANPTSVAFDDSTGIITVVFPATGVALVPGFLNSAGTANLPSISQITSSKSSSADIEIPFYFDGKAISSVTFTGGAENPMTTAEYGTNGNNFVLKKGGSTGFLKTSGNGVKTIKIILADGGGTFSFAIEVTN